MNTTRRKVAYLASFGFYGILDTKGQDDTSRDIQPATGGVAIFRRIWESWDPSILGAKSCLKLTIDARNRMDLAGALFEQADGEIGLIVAKTMVMTNRPEHMTIIESRNVPRSRLKDATALIKAAYNLEDPTGKGIAGLDGEHFRIKLAKTADSPKERSIEFFTSTGGLNSGFYDFATNARNFFDIF